MRSNKINVTRPFLPPIEEFEAYLNKIWESSILTNQGTLHNQFEKELCDYLKIPNVTLFVNGHLALDTAIKSLNLNGEVITTPFTFASTAHAITMNNLTPVFCDIKPDDFTIDEEKIESLITEKTSAIVPVHVYGHPCNVKAINDVAKKYNLKVIYDAAHAFGVTLDHQPIGSFGDISMFSFHATKVFHTIEGGALTYNNSGLRHRLDLLKNFGIANADTVEIMGLNAKMNEFQAAMGLCNLKHIDEIIKCRKNVTAYYKQKLENVPGLHFMKLPPNIKYNYAYLPVQIDETEFGYSRDEIVSVFEKHEIYPRKYFYPLVTQFDCYKRDYVNSLCPVAEMAANSIITLPLYADIEEQDIIRVCDVLTKSRKKLYPVQNVQI